ncbi:hypothetical protein TPA0907_21170 [Micromonospora humidisoli]|nr:hypothetical protein TPA0907_21170 [Micromonospora sp. AKA109]
MPQPCQLKATGSSTTGPHDLGRHPTRPACRQFTPGIDPTEEQPDAAGVCRNPLVPSPHPGRQSRHRGRRAGALVISNVLSMVFGGLVPGFLLGLLAFRVKSRWCPRCGGSTHTVPVPGHDR